MKALIVTYYFTPFLFALIISSFKPKQKSLICTKDFCISCVLSYPIHNNEALTFLLSYQNDTITDSQAIVYGDFNRSDSVNV